LGVVRRVPAQGGPWTARGMTPVDPEPGSLGSVTREIPDAGTAESDRLVVVVVRGETP